MRILAPLASLCLISLMLAGCPLASHQPLSDPTQARIDRSLLGQWVMKDPETGEEHTLTILAFDEHAMVALLPADPGPGTDAYRLFVTTVGSETFLNAQELGTTETDWTLVHYTVDGTRLVLSPVDDTLFSDRSFSTPAELRAFVQANLGNPRLYAAEGETRQDMILQRPGT